MVKYMAKLLGEGATTLDQFVNRCRQAGGVPILRTKYKKRDLRNAVVVACRGAKEKIPGGVITGVSADQVARYRKARGLRLADLLV